MTVQDGSQTFAVPAQAIEVTDINQPAKIEHAPVIVFSSKDPELLKSADLKGKAVVVALPVVRENSRGSEDDSVPKGAGVRQRGRKVWRGC